MKPLNQPHDMKSCHLGFFNNEDLWLLWIIRMFTVGVETWYRKVNCLHP